MSFFTKYCNELSTFRYSKLMLDDFQILQALYLFFPFLPVVVILEYTFHFPIWSSFEILN